MKLLRRNEQIDVCKAIPLCSQLSKRDLGEVARRADQVAVESGKLLAREGELGREFLVLVRGKARVEKGGRKVRQLGPGDYFGEITLIKPGLRTASVVAETDVEVLVIGTREFAYLLDHVRGLAKKLLYSLCDYIQADAKLTK